METQPLDKYHQNNIYKNILDIAAALCENALICISFFEQDHIEINSQNNNDDLFKEIKVLAKSIPEELYHISNIHTDELFKTSKLKTLCPSCQSYSFFPLKNNDAKTVGHLIIIRKEGGLLTDQEIKLLTSLSLQVEEISNAFKIKAELRKHQDGLRLLNEISETNSLDLETRLNEILRVVTEYLNLEAGIISKVENQIYSIYDFYPDDIAAEKNQEFKFDNTYCQITYNSHETFHVSHMANSEHKTHPCYDNFKVETYIGAAYYINGIKTGTVNFTQHKKRESPFSIYDIDFVTIATRLIGHLIEQKTIKDRLNKEHNILKAFILSTPAAIAMYDEKLKFITASTTWRERYSETINFHSDIITKWKNAHKNALQGEIIKQEEEKTYATDGSKIWLKWEIRPWYIDENIGGTLILINDITKSKQQEAELKKAKELAEETGEMKAQFLSTMSHEIRTPLNAIIGTIKLLEIENPMLAEDERMSLLKFGSNNLLSLINDVLDSQKIDFGEVSIKNSPFNLKELTYNIIESWYPVAHENNIKLEYTYDEALSETYKGDNTRIGQILNNLISNGIKFTAEGSVKLEVISKSENEIQFTITDTGIGIPPDQIDLIFEDYKQIKNQHTQKQGGTGLGLSISRKLIALMGGNLTVTSELDKGSIFRFSLTLNSSAQQENEALNKKQHSIKLDLTALLVEDNIPNQVIAQGFLKKWGINTIIANNGVEAVEKIKQKGIDFVLMDISMPIMNGYEATAAIREMDDPYFKTVPIIALSASTSKTTHEKAINIGMNDFMTKPFDPQELHLKINILTNKEETPKTEFKFLSELFKLNKDQVLRIATLSIDSIEESISLIEKHIINNDATGIADQYHKMRPNLIHLDLEFIAEQLPERETKNLLEESPSIVELVKQHISNIKRNTSYEL